MADSSSSKTTRFFGIFVPLAKQFALPGLVLSLVAFLAFLILFFQGLLQNVFLIAMVLAGVLAGIFLAAFVLGMIGSRYLSRNE